MEQSWKRSRRLQRETCWRNEEKVFTFKTCNLYSYLFLRVVKLVKKCLFNRSILAWPKHTNVRWWKRQR